MAPSPSTLTELCTSMLAQARVVDEYIAAQRLPYPSLDANGPSDFPAPKDAADVQAARFALIEAAQHIAELAAGPRESLRWKAWNSADYLSLRAVIHYDIAHAVPETGTVTFAQIAQHGGISEDQARRLLRHAMTMHLFTEPQAGHVAHTSKSLLLRTDPQMQDWVGMTVEDILPGHAKSVDAINKWHASEEPHECGFTLANGTRDFLFAELAKNPRRHKRFGGAMASLTGGEGYEPAYLIKGYPWAEIGKGTVVDVGGSHGFISVALAESFPDLSFVVQDLPDTVRAGEGKIPAHLRDRVRLMPHDFLTPQPVQGADVYLFRWILHNWSDKYGLQILRQLIPALKPGARIVINDYCLPEPNSVPLWDEKILRTMDLTMMTLLNARERARGDWDALFQKADPRFHFKDAWRPENSKMHIIEAVWEG